MQVSDFFMIFRSGKDGRSREFLGTAFPVRSNGGLLTCRHVVDISLEDGEQVCVHDATTGQLVPIGERRLPTDPKLDLGFLPAAVPGENRPFFPILPPESIVIGEDVYSFGFFLDHSHRDRPEHGYFKGNIVNTNHPTATPAAAITVSYPIIEGMSGSPVLTYHNGPKVVGVAYGSVSTRVTASEVVEYEDGDLRLRETVLRMLEFGLAYGSDVLLQLNDELGIGLTVTPDGVPNAGV